MTHVELRCIAVPPLSGRDIRSTIPVVVRIEGRSPQLKWVRYQLATSQPLRVLKEWTVKPLEIVRKSFDKVERRDHEAF